MEGPRERGYDAGKKVLGRKRHIAVDSGGRLLAVKITAPTSRIRTAESRWFALAWLTAV